MYYIYISTFLPRSWVVRFDGDINLIDVLREKCVSRPCIMQLIFLTVAFSKYLTFPLDVFASRQKVQTKALVGMRLIKRFLSPNRCLLTFSLFLLSSGC